MIRQPDTVPAPAPIAPPGQAACFSWQGAQYQGAALRTCPPKSVGQIAQFVRTVRMGGSITANLWNHRVVT